MLRPDPGREPDSESESGIPLDPDVLLSEEGPTIAPNEALLLEHLPTHYPEIELETEIDFSQHLSTPESLTRYPNEVTAIPRAFSLDLER